MTTTSPLTITTFLSSDAGLNSVCSLIQGTTDSVLVDVPFLLSDARNLVQTVKDSGTRLTTIFVTHGLSARSDPSWNGRNRRDKAIDQRALL